MKEKYGFNWKREKDALFARHEVSSVPELLATLCDLRSRDYFFRGLSDARYKIVSSIQRAWHNGGRWKSAISNTNFTAFMIGLLEFAKKNELFSFCPKSCLMDHEIWAYLQHYGCPTPLLDFSSNPFVALHFATKSASETKGYCSIYAIQPSGTEGEKIQDIVYLDEYIQQTLGQERSQREFAWRPWKACSPRTYALARFKHWGFWQAGQIIPEDPYPYPADLPDDGIAFYISKNGGNWCSKITAGRLNLQEGLFVYAPIENESLEDFIMRKVRKVKTDKGVEESEDVIYQKVKCFDIPAKLVRELREVVAGEHISNDSLGLSPCPEENAVKTMYGAYLNSLQA